MKNLLLNEGYQELNNYFTSGKGSKIYIKKREYLDLSLSAGSHILGHNSKILKSMNDLFKLIFQILPKNRYAIDFSKTLKKILPKYSKFIFATLNRSGNEITKSCEQFQKNNYFCIW